MKIKMEIEVDVAPYDAAVEPKERWHAQARVSIISTPHPLVRYVFSGGVYEAPEASQALAWAVGYALDKLEFTKSPNRS